MISLLGGILTQDESIVQAVRSSVNILADRQSPTGCIPNNVDPETGRPNFRAYADAGLWWVIGSSLVDPKPATIDVARMDKVLRWYECQDVDQSGLISMQESADWQDLFCTRGKGLYLNALYVLALETCARGAEGAGAERLAAQAQKVRDRINRYFWYAGDGNMLPSVAHTFSTDTPEAQDSLGRKRWLPQKRLLIDEQYYLPYLAFRTPGEWFDTLGHLIAILAGVANQERTRITLEFIERTGLAHHPAKAIYPPVEPADPDWRDYYGMLNTPNHYHNGGIWPFIGGFYVAALVHAGMSAEASSALQRLASLNEQGDFNEWHHGATAEPMGVRHQAWSSAMYIYAWHVVQAGRILLLPSV